jgi:hypothetical protein
VTLTAVLLLALALGAASFTLPQGSSAPTRAVGADPTPSRPPSTAARTTGADVLRFAVIGDVPYTDAQRAQFAAWIDQLNADPRLRFTVHVGDIKAGAAPCTDEYDNQIKLLFDRFERPLVYTPGDNEWADCHRPSAGRYNPLERLARLRSVFFPVPGTTMGRQARSVESEAPLGFPENVTWRDGGASFAALHVVGSADATRPWGSPGSSTAQATAQAARAANAKVVVAKAFANARAGGDAAVILFLQADLFPATDNDDDLADPDATGIATAVYAPLVQTIARESRAWNRPVLIVNGDSHHYVRGNPLTPGSPWLRTYQFNEPVPLLERVTVVGAERMSGYLRVTVDPSAFAVVSIEQVPFARSG